MGGSGRTSASFGDIGAGDLVKSPNRCLTSSKISESFFQAAHGHEQANLNPKESIPRFISSGNEARRRMQ